MADRIRDVGGGANHYPTLSAWEAGEQADLVALDERRIAHCYNFSDTTPVVLAGWTTDATRYAYITVPSGQRHDGKWSTSGYRLEITSGTGIDVQIRDALIEYIQISIQENGATQRFGIHVSATATGQVINVEKCILRQHPSSSGSGNLRGVRLNTTGTIRVSNTLFIDWRQGSGSGFSRSAGTGYIYNCGAHNCNIGIGAGSGPVTAINSWAQNCTDGFQGSYAAASSNNLSDIATDAPGTGPITGDISFVDEANDDFHLAAGDTLAKDAGINLSADANYPISGDIDGQARSGTWDIGPDEYVVVASGGSFPPLGRRRKLRRLFHH